MSHIYNHKSGNTLVHIEYEVDALKHLSLLPAPTSPVCLDLQVMYLLESQIFPRFGRHFSDWIPKFADTYSE